MSESKKFYRLQEAKIQHGGISTAAILSCATCGTIISGMGGGGGNAICEPCAEVIMSGQACNMITWSESDPVANAIDKAK